jgi:protein-tyrosine phosphatase
MLARWSTAPGVMLIHCAAGKDRTGLAVALIQETLSTRRAAISAEYLRSNDVAATPDQFEMASRHLARILGRSPPDFMANALLGVSGGHLSAALESIEARSGSVAAYVRELHEGSA